MAYAYITNIENADDINSQLASVAYVNESLKQFKDALTKILNTSILFESYNPELKKLPEKEIDLSNIPAENINIDSNHKFLTEAELSVLKDKPTTHDVNVMIDELKKELLDTITNKFDFIFSNINSLENIRYLINLLNDDDRSKGIIDLINSKASNKDFEEHIKSIYHLSSNDRKALNELIKFIKSGCADWNATEKDPNYIRNKPDSLPANGGDAETISGYNIDVILNHQLENLIIGYENNNYSENEVDIMLSTKEETQYLFDKIKDGGIYSFRKGAYECDSIELNNGNNNIIIHGAGNLNTIFNINTIKASTNISFDNICFKDSNIIIGANCEFTNCTFINCDINLMQSINCKIDSCNFTKSIFMFNGVCLNNIIINNRFFNGRIPFYSGGNNIIVNNISC